MTGKNGKLGFREKDRKRTRKNHINITNKEYDWDHMTEARMVKGFIEKVTGNKTMKPGKAAGSCNVCAKMIFASGSVEIGVMLELVLDGTAMPDEWLASVLVPTSKGKDEVTIVMYAEEKIC